MVDQKAPAAVQAEVKELDARATFKRVVVNRLNVSENNQNLEIVVNDLGIKNGRKSFYPGQEVELSLAQIAILKDAVERNHIDIPTDSGAYSADNPVEAVKQLFPGFLVKQNKQTGLIYAEKHRPNYSVSEVSGIL